MTGKKPKLVFDFYQLEDRILLSGEGTDGGELPDADPDLAAALMAELVEADGQVLEDPAVTAALNPTAIPTQDESTEETGDLADIPTFDPALPLEVVFVDSDVEDAKTLFDGLRGNSEDQTQWLVIELSPDEDGVEQITRELSELSGVDAVHILGHGDGQGVELGSTRLDIDTADGYAGNIASWADSLDADADLLIYGCDLASTVEGRALIDSIGALCDCDVAASDDATGNADYGGDWILEYAVGDVDTGIAFNMHAQTNWGGLLSVINVTQTDDVVNGSITSVADLIGNDGGDGISLREAILATNADSGVDDTINIAAGTYALAYGGTLEDLAGTGDLDITDDLTINGAGTGLTFIDGAALDRVFDVRSGTVISFSNSPPATA